jgi:hypothetical protein
MKTRSDLGDIPDGSESTEADVLRPDLYRRLSQRFGRVEITHEQEEMSASVKLSDKTDKNGQRYRELDVTSAGEVYRINCPFCTDTRRRLWINHMFGYRDKETRVSYMWLANCFNDYCPLAGNMDLRFKLYRMIYDDVIGNDFSGADVVRPGKKHTGEPEAVQPPGRLLSLSSLPADHRALAYIRERGHDPALLQARYKVSYCTEADRMYPMATGRIIIPVVMRGKTVGWQARYVGNPPNKLVPKYYTMPHMPKGSILYNFDLAKEQPYVVVTEGVFDAWRYGPEAVCLFGCKPSSVQVQLLYGTWKDKTIYCLLDGTAVNENQALKDVLSRAHPRVVRVDLPADKDPDDCSSEFLRRLVGQAAL